MYIIQYSGFCTLFFQTRVLFFPRWGGIQYLAFNNGGYVAFAHSARRIIVGCSGATRRGGVITAKRAPRCRLRRNCLQTFNIGRVGTIAVKARQLAAYENWRSWKRHSDRGSTCNARSSIPSSSPPPLDRSAYIHTLETACVYTRAMCYIYTRVRARRARSREENGGDGEK